ncbi:MAG: MFS transporter, partial [Pseudomonadota bacterium]
MTSFVFTKRFWPLFGANTLGAFADNTLRMATIVAVYAAFTAGGGGTFDLPHGLGEHAGSLVSVAFTLPVFIFSVLAGQLADKIHRHTLIRVLKWIELVLMAAAAVCFALGNGPLLVLALFLMGTQSAFFSPVRNAVMPQYYDRDELIRANGYYNAALFVAVVTGLGLGGYFVNQGGGRIIVSIMLIMAAAGGAILAGFIPKAPSPGLTRINWNVPVVIARQLNFVRTIKGIWYPMLGVAWFWMLGAAVLANLP